jgi:hypothetical protein
LGGKSSNKPYIRTQLREFGTMNRITGFFHRLIKKSTIFTVFKKIAHCKKQLKPTKKFPGNVP